MDPTPQDRDGAEEEADAEESREQLSRVAPIVWPFRTRDGQLGAKDQCPGRPHVQQAWGAQEEGGQEAR